MEMFETRVGDSIAIVTMNRAPVNAMNDAWVRSFHEVLDALEARDDWAVLRLRSALKIFSAGADLKQIEANRNLSIEAQLEPGRRFQALFDRIERLGRPSVAEVQGMALGGGLELALACDFRLASEEAKLGLPEVTLGLIPGAGGTQRLPRACNGATALRLILGGEVITAAEAKAIGLVQWTAPAAQFEEVAERIARRFASVPSHASQAAKAAVRAAFEPGCDGFRVETEGVRRCLSHPRTSELVSAFLSPKKQAVPLEEGA